MNLKMFRKRFIPDEIVDISKDQVLYLDDELMVTKWETIRPREDFSSGLSFSFLKEGYKLSKFIDKNGNLVYWYCDIIDVQISTDKNTYMFIDLLVDVKIMPDGEVIVLDLEEIEEALEKKLITKEQADDAILKLKKLEDIIKAGNFPPEKCKEMIKKLNL